MAFNMPVLVGPVPLLKVQTYLVTEGFKTASIAASQFTQMVGLMTKTIDIDALLVGDERALRPALETLALNTVPGVSWLFSKAELLIGIPVISKNFVHLDMQITQLKFTQDSTSRETLTVHVQLTNVPRPKLLGGFLPGVDVALGVGMAFL